MNEYTFQWSSPCLYRAAVDLKLLYGSSVHGKRKSAKQKIRIYEEEEALEKDFNLANRFLTSVYYLKYISDKISENGCIFPWNEPLLSSEMIAGILNLPFSPLENGLRFIALDFNRLTAFPEPDDPPELIVIASENCMKRIKQLTRDFIKLINDYEDGFEKQRFFVRIISVSEESLALLTCFKDYRKSILKRLARFDFDRIPKEVRDLFPFVVDRIRLDAGDEPSFAYCVDSLEKELKSGYGDVSRVFALLFANYVYSICLSDALDKASENEKHFLRLIPENTLLGYKRLLRYNAVHATAGSTEKQLFDFEGFHSKNAYERRLLLERAYFTFDERKWLEEEAKRYICKEIRKLCNEWPSYDFPYDIVRMLTDKQKEAAELILSWIGSRCIDRVDIGQLREIIGEAAAILYRRCFTPGSVVFSDESTDGIPYEEIGYSADSDYISHLALIPDDKEFKCFELASWVIVYNSDLEMVSSKICCFISVSSESKNAHATYQVVCRRLYESVEDAVTDLGKESLGFPDASESEAIRRIKQANARHGIENEGEGVVALKLMPFDEKLFN